MTLPLNRTLPPATPQPSFSTYYTSAKTHLSALNKRCSSLVHTIQQTLPTTKSEWSNAIHKLNIKHLSIATFFVVLGVTIYIQRSGSSNTACLEYNALVEKAVAHAREQLSLGMPSTRDGSELDLTTLLKNDFWGCDQEQTVLQDMLNAQDFREVTNLVAITGDGFKIITFLQKLRFANTSADFPAQDKATANILLGKQYNRLLQPNVQSHLRNTICDIYQSLGDYQKVATELKASCTKV